LHSVAHARATECKWILAVVLRGDRGGCAFAFVRAVSQARGMAGSADPIAPRYFESDTAVASSSYLVEDEVS
jgi:hypothetical protein